MKCYSSEKKKKLKTGGVTSCSFITEMAAFTVETDDSREMGYPFDNSRQIGNAS